jgi:hypothetical protein
MYGSNDNALNEWDVSLKQQTILVGKQHSTLNGIVKRY